MYYPKTLSLHMDVPQCLGVQIVAPIQQQQKVLGKKEQEEEEEEEEVREEEDHHYHQTPIPPKEHG